MKLFFVLPFVIAMVTLDLKLILLMGTANRPVFHSETVTIQRQVQNF